ncbi:uncharacterized protein KY384_008483 [Bacidia gigantensis]|uniref:uncharacterized protein n=1 Tax=Bacidia gigantensis TaxID=2732470 RepID=UPI001D047C67|nr:uncharacterized protein KY384_008483 [Bacidia gigantensis]KAG8527054.1 hypothetical protein KY384_008483 [Bacidia gigantensis]
MCARWDHQSVYKNNTLYIDGGKQTFIDEREENGEIIQEGNITVGYRTKDNYIITIDMSKSWNWETNISEAALERMPIQQSQTKPPVVSRGAFFYGGDSSENVYLWGGTTSYLNRTFPGFEPPMTSQYSLWSYKPSDNTWAQFDTGSTVQNRPSSGSFAEVREQNLAFYFNGQLDSGSQVSTQVFGDDPKVFLKGMIMLDLANQTARNLSTDAVVGDQPRSRCVPKAYAPLFYGTKLIIVRFLSATRYMHGGRSSDDLEANIFYDDVYILSIPSFTWTKVYESKRGKAGHTCHRVGPSKMILVGGTNSMNYTEGCDWHTKGVGVMDMNEIVWGRVYDANAEDYQVPVNVSRRIGGDKNGGAAMRQPTLGFDQEGLAKIFNGTTKAKTLQNATVTNTPSKMSPSNTISKSIIVCTAVGAVALVGVTGSLVYLYRRGLYQIITKTEWPFVEMDGSGREDVEIMTNSVCWELPAMEKPVELAVRCSSSKFREKSGKREVKPPSWVPPVTDEGVPF